MSSVAVHETETPAEHTARVVNSDFQFIADRLPTEVKEAPAGEAFTLCSVEGVGILWAMYGGARRDPTGEAIMEYRVHIGMCATESAVDLTFGKNFGLTYQTMRAEGQLTDLRPITAQEVDACPVSTGVLEFLTLSLREEFMRLRGESLPVSEDVVHLDSYRERVV